LPGRRSARRRSRRSRPPRVEVRAAGGLVLLYGLPVSRISELTADDVISTDSGHVLQLGPRHDRTVVDLDEVLLDEALEFRLYVGCSRGGSYSASAPRTARGRAAAPARPSSTPGRRPARSGRTGRPVPDRTAPGSSCREVPRPPSNSLCTGRHNNTERTRFTATVTSAAPRKPLTSRPTRRTRSTATTSAAAPSRPGTNPRNPCAGRSHAAWYVRCSARVNPDDGDDEQGRAEQRHRLGGAGRTLHESLQVGRRRAGQLQPVDQETPTAGRSRSGTAAATTMSIGTSATNAWVASASARS
jgi:hypothetical protein